MKKVYSSISKINWLIKIEKEKGIKLIRNFNVTDKKIGKFSVDGYDKKNKIAYEFLYSNCQFQGVEANYSTRGTKNSNKVLWSKTSKRFDQILKNSSVHKIMYNDDNILFKEYI